MSSETDSSIVQYVQGLLNNGVSSHAANHDSEKDNETAPRNMMTGELEVIVDSIPFPAAAVAEDGRVAAFNSEYSEFFGVPASSLQNTHLGEVEAIPEAVAARPAQAEEKDTETTIDLPDDASTVRVTIRSNPHDFGSTGNAGGMIQTVVPHTSLVSVETNGAERWDTPGPTADDAKGSPRPTTDEVGTEATERSVADEEKTGPQPIIDDVDAVISALRQNENESLEETVSPKTAVVVDELVPAIEQYAVNSSRSGGGTTALIDNAETIADTGETLASDIREQSDILADSVADAQTLAGRMNTVAERASETNEAASEAATRASEGTEIVSETQAVATDAVQATGELEEIVEATVEQMKTIENTVSVIEETADKINMLALNANIEAARASNDGGETDGFAVVANEVKQLANDTQSRTDDIVHSLEELQACINEVAATTETVESCFSTADQRLSEVNTLFTDIADAVETVADGIEDVSVENEAQATDIDEITNRIEESQAICETNQMMADELTDESSAMINELTQDRGD